MSEITTVELEHHRVSNIMSSHNETNLKSGDKLSMKTENSLSERTKCIQ